MTTMRKMPRVLGDGQRGKERPWSEAMILACFVHVGLLECEMK